ncbi:MAG: MFS transporter, partial [Sulfuricaulis sp.]|nr:MFS transporter [Sulfuricaulis sp.]
MSKDRQYSRDPQVERSLRYSVRDGVAWSVMFGAGESYLQAFAVFLKATTAQITLLAALPSLLGSLSQLASGWIVGRAVQRKSLIFGGVLLQTLTWLPIIALAFVPTEHPVLWLILWVALYYIGGQFAAPPWSSLISELVPERRRGRFFGRRTQIMSIFTFVSLGTAGIALELFAQRAAAGWGFALVFAVALAARIYSLHQLMRMHEPLQRLAPLTLPPLAGLLGRLRGSDFATFAMFVALLNLAVAMASPFFTLYMLRDLKFSYLEFTAVSAFYVLI